MMEQAILVSTLLTPVVAGLIQIIKQSSKVENRYLPYFSPVIGVLFGLIYAYLYKEPLPDYLIGGLISGLAAGGFYNALTAPKN